MAAVMVFEVIRLIIFLLLIGIDLGRGGLLADTLLDEE